MIPKKELLAEGLVESRPPGAAHWSDEDIALLARRYWVSHEVLVRRLLICGLTTKEFYLEKRAHFLARAQTHEKGFVPPAQMALSLAGNIFARLVLDNYYRGNITSSDVADFLDVKLKHLGKIEQRVMGRRTPFGFGAVA
ncbi:MAG: hypothetical protein ACP5M0_06170 [Desulfomonilaceae bacterium]